MVSKFELIRSAEQAPIPSSEKVYRIQPPGLGLNHRSETSSGELSQGVHVFKDFDEMRTALRDWVEDPETPTQEIVVIRTKGPAEEVLEDNEDFEGWILPARSGKIVERHTFNNWNDLREFVENQQEIGDLEGSKQS